MMDANFQQNIRYIDPIIVRKFKQIEFLSLIKIYYI
jgi:hypothetical protein